MKSTGILITALVLVLTATLDQTSVVQPYWPEILLATSMVLWLAHFRLRFTHYQATLIHALTLTTGLSIGIAPTFLALSMGMLLYALIDIIRSRSIINNPVQRNNLIQMWTGIWSRQVLANGLGLYAYFLLGGKLGATSKALPEFLPFIGTLVGFSLLYLFLHWIHPNTKQIFTGNRREVIRLITIALAPAPVVLLAVSAFVYLGPASFILYCVILAVATPIFSSLIRMEIKLSQRAENLGLLSELSTAITSSKDPKAVSNHIISTSISIGCGDKAILDLYPSTKGELEYINSKNLSQDFMNGWGAQDPKDTKDVMFFQETEAMFFSLIERDVFPQRIERLLQVEGIVALASLPLQTSHSKLGRLTILSTDPITFSLRRRELLTLFASQAAFALSNAFAHASADVELSLQSDQLSRLEEINRQLTTSTDSDNLHEIILDHAIEASAAEWGYLALYQSETGKLHFVAHTGRDKKNKKLLEEPQFESSEGIFGRAFQTGQILNIPDTSLDPNTLDPIGTHATSVLCVPVCGPEEMLGVIGVESGRRKAFTNSHEQFLTQLAAYAANALHHAQIYHELQDRLTEQSLLYQASTQIAESLESDAVGLAIADSLRVTVQANSASVYYWLEETQTLVLMARIDEGRPSSKPIPIDPEMSKLLGHAQCIKDRVSMQWSSVEEVSTFEKEYLLENYGKGRILLLPLSIGERTLGIIEIFRKDRTPFSEAAIRSAQSIAIQASIALDNTELFQKFLESHTRLTAILNSTREGILLIDTDGVISIANRQMELMVGIGIQDLLQQSLDDPSLDLASRLGYLPQDLKQLVDSLRQGQAQLAGAATYESADKTGKTFFRIDTPVYDPSSQLIGWLISMRDISEQKEIEETREQLTTMIVHDLRSPLTAILNSIFLMRRELDTQSTSSAVEQALGVADRSVNQMLGLVNSLLDISRLESGKLKISPIDVPIHPLMTELQERFQIEANSIGIILKTSYSDTGVITKMDQEKIRRVLSNLLDNALKFTPVGGVIELGYTDSSQEVIFWVSDTGPGIPPEFQEKIFERYIQIPGSTGRRRGTGLGLAFAKLAVEAHGGRLWVEDNPEGGSVFKFSLPYDRPA